MTDKSTFLQTLSVKVDQLVETTAKNNAAAPASFRVKLAALVHCALDDPDPANVQAAVGVDGTKQYHLTIWFNELGTCVLSPTELEYTIRTILRDLLSPSGWTVQVNHGVSNFTIQW